MGATAPTIQDLFATLRVAIHQMVPKILAEQRMSPHAEIALEHSGQILWVTFASECALT